MTSLQTEKKEEKTGGGRGGATVASSPLPQFASMVVHADSGGRVLHSAHNVIDVGHIMRATDHHLSPMAAWLRVTWVLAVDCGLAATSVAGCWSFKLGRIQLHLSHEKFAKAHIMDRVTAKQCENDAQKGGIGCDSPQLPVASAAYLPLLRVYF